MVVKDPQWMMRHSLTGVGDDPDEAPEAFVEQLLSEGNHIGFASMSDPN
jgi:hypothetical protein